MKKYLFMFYVLIFFCTIPTISNAVTISNDLIITETATADGVDGTPGLIFDVYNKNVVSSGVVDDYRVYSFIIGAADPAGEPWAGGHVAWDDELTAIVPHTYNISGNPTTVYQVREGNYDPDPNYDESHVLFELVGDEWANYNYGYFFYTYDQTTFTPSGYRPIGYGETLTVYALGGQMGSPFAYTNYPVDPSSSSNIPTGYGTTQHSGGSAPVPEPATIFLFGSALAGLIGTKFRRKK